MRAEHGVSLMQSGRVNTVTVEGWLCHLGGAEPGFVAQAVYSDFCCYAVEHVTDMLQRLVVLSL